jgi:hypothetical protein
MNCSLQSGSLGGPKLYRLPGPFPNTDPGLAGETGTSGVAGAVYGVDGLNIGGGIDGDRLNSGAPTPRCTRAWLCTPVPTGLAAATPAAATLKRRAATSGVSWPAMRAMRFRLNVCISGSSGFRP